VGSHQLKQLELEADRQGGIAVLTEDEESATLRYTRGDEAEMLITEIIKITDRLISFLGKEWGDGKCRS